MKQFIRKMFGIDKLLVEKEQAQLETAKAKEEERVAKLAPKERATAKGEPWVSVLDTKVNKDNPRNGFFELDWNDLFIVQLKQAGYGFDGDPEEEIVDRWFRDLYSAMIQSEGIDPKDRTAGYVNVTRLPGGKAEIE
jgi:hypothetical protein